MRLCTVGSPDLHSDPRTKHLASLLTPIYRKPRGIAGARQAVPKAMCRTYVIVSTQVAGLIGIAPYSKGQSIMLI